MSKKKKSRRLNQPMAAAEHRAAPLRVHWGRALPGRPHPSRPRSLVEHRLQFQFVLFTILKVAGGKKKYKNICVRRTSGCRTFIFTR